MGVDVSFCELRTKMVINVVDGKALGRISDMIFSRENAKVVGVIVPGDKNFHIFGRKNELFVPYDRIIRIGVDAVLVELRSLNNSQTYNVVTDDNCLISSKSRCC